MDTREETPPHYPTYGVHLSDDEIEEISRICLPAASQSYTFTRLAHGKSFNNRIYFIKDASDDRKSYVLKVTGNNFGATKVENEVASLQILKRFCPTVPVPEVVAWSLDGCRINLARSENQNSDSEAGTVNSRCRHEWILMTCLTGEAMDLMPTSLTREDISRLSLQLAQMIANWRSGVPKSDQCGNLRFRSESSSTKSPSWQKNGAKVDLGYEIDGVLDNGIDHTDQPLYTILSLWRAKLSKAIKNLSSGDVYAANRDPLLPLLEQFTNATLAGLSVFRSSQEQPHSFIFSHTDLSPRNVLISGSPPQISGIVDFEFSGFFPVQQDFTGNSVISDEVDEEGWPVDMHNQILQYLEECGEQTPLRLKGSSEWNELMDLEKLAEFIAPWWLSTGEVDADKIVKDLRDARREVEEALAALTKSV